MLTDENCPAEVNIYIESQEGKDGSSVYDIGKKPVKLPSLSAHHISSKTSGDSATLPKLGISLIAISQDARFAATKNELQPHVVWIWDLTRLYLNSVMIQR
jgi:hypothetical protein